MALAMQLSQYRAQAAAKIASLAGRPSLEPAARQELEELTAVLQAALAQVGTWQPSGPLCAQLGD